MATGYEMFVDYDTLCEIEDKLKKIEYDLNNSTEKMVNAIRKSQEFLSGDQFEKAKITTMNCVELTRKTETNIKYAWDYIEKLCAVLKEYGECSYTGEV